MGMIDAATNAMQRVGARLEMRRIGMGGDTARIVSAHHDLRWGGSDLLSAITSTPTFRVTTDFTTGDSSVVAETRAAARYLKTPEGAALRSYLEDMLAASREHPRYRSVDAPGGTTYINRIVLPQDLDQASAWKALHHLHWHVANGPVEAAAGHELLRQGRGRAITDNVQGIYASMRGSWLIGSSWFGRETTDLARQMASGSVDADLLRRVTAVLTHELTHAQEPYRSSHDAIDVPTWFSEGLTEVLSEHAFAGIMETIADTRRVEEINLTYPRNNASDGYQQAAADVRSHFASVGLTTDTQIHDHLVDMSVPQAWEFISRQSNIQ